MNKSHTTGWRGAFAIGFFIVAAVVAVAVWVLRVESRPASLTLEDALWVSDWDITALHGPGTEEQRDIVRQLLAFDHDFGRFETPILYRMGGSSAVGAPEGILLIPFDPRRPEDAFELRAESAGE